MCSQKLHYTSLYSTVEPLYTVLANQYRVLIYSGDTDGSVPFVGTVEWIKDFEGGTKPDVDWLHWTLNGQVVGYRTSYPNLEFTTVKGAGHMVPQDKPEVAYAMFSQFLAGTFPTNS